MGGRPPDGTPIPKFRASLAAPALRSGARACAGGRLGVSSVRRWSAGGRARPRRGRGERMRGRPPRRATSSGPLDPADRLDPDDAWNPAADDPEQLALLPPEPAPAGSASRAGAPSVPPAVPYAPPDALPAADGRDASDRAARDPDLP